MRRFSLTILALVSCVFFVFAEEGVKAGDVNINATNFPDANFREYVTQFDLDGNGILSQTELNAVETISILQDNNIYSIVGVKYFSNLKYLYIRRNHLSSLDVSGMSKIEELICANNQLASININGCSSLTMLFLNGNKFQSLDLRNCNSLESVHCCLNELTSLNISGMSNLTYFYCYNNNLSSINLSGLPSLRRLECQNNQFTSLNVSELENLWVFNCSGNSLSSLDLTGLNKLEHLYINGCGFKGLVIDEIVNSLVTYSTPTGNLNVVSYYDENPSMMTPAQVQAAREKGWYPKHYPEGSIEGWIDYDGEYCQGTVVGDVNGDGTVTAADVTAIYDYLLNNDQTFGLAYDVSGDGFVTSTDVTLIYNILLGNEIMMTEFDVFGIKFRMVEVEGGTFTMGATSEQGSDATDNETPTHQVTLSPFSIGQTEVTQELWQAVMGSNPSSHVGANLPVENMTWDECQEFITSLNQITGKTFRLPTEAEWEYAARGGNKSKGYKYSGSNTVDDVAWYTGNSNGTSHEVGQKAPNELGLYDMSGNVEEWCNDHYVNYTSSPQTDPVGYAGTWGDHNLRGGYFTSAHVWCRVSKRDCWFHNQKSNEIGLRLVLVNP